jgi:hypothetical protein
VTFLSNRVQTFSFNSPGQPIRPFCRYHGSSSQVFDGILSSIRHGTGSGRNGTGFVRNGTGFGTNSGRNRICWSASVRPHLLVRMCSTVSVGPHVFDRICCSASVRPYLLVRICWSASVVPHLFDRICWSACVRPYLLVRICSTVSVGSYLLFRITWSVRERKKSLRFLNHSVWPELRKNCVKKFPHELPRRQNGLRELAGLTN